VPKLRQFIEKTDPLNALGCVASCLRNLRSIPDTGHFFRCNWFLSVDLVKSRSVGKFLV